MSLVKSLTLAFVLCLVAFCGVSPSRGQAQGNKPAGSVQGDRDPTLQHSLPSRRYENSQASNGATDQECRGPVRPHG